MIANAGWPLLLLLGTASYLVGSIPFGLVLGRVLKGVDIRQHGSGNIGAANAFRVLGKGGGTLVLLLDLLKGWGPVVLAGAAFQGGSMEAMARVVVGALAIVGHNNSVYLGFKGGKGIATSFGVMLGISPLATLVAALTWGAAVALWRYSSVGSLSATVSIPLTLVLTRAPREYVLLGVVMCALAFARHRRNIRNLLQGKELKIFSKN